MARVPAFRGATTVGVGGAWANPAGRARRARRPQHKFTLQQTPWVIQPFLLAPVLPGETLKNLMVQSRVVSDPVVSRLHGWWLEYYFFYVKITDVDDRDTLQQMFVDPNTSISTLYEATSAPYYHVGGTPNYAKMCLKCVVEHYFRDEAEAWDVATIPVGGVNMPVASVGDLGWTDSLMGRSDYTSLDINVDADGDSTITAREVDQQLALWAVLRQNGVTTLDYESYLASMGVNVPRDVPHRPELLRYVREWQYPVNTVNPTNGTPTSALSWSIAERADKNRYFSEPGWIFGVTVARPKVYRGNQAGSAADYMRGTMSWLPMLAKTNPEVSMVFLDGAATGAESLIGGAAEDYVWDVKDLLIHGDQFLNVAPGPTVAPEVQLPASDMSHVYPAEADVDPLFVTGETGCFVDQDGIVQLTIDSQMWEDSTPGTPEV